RQQSCLLVSEGGGQQSGQRLVPRGGEQAAALERVPGRIRQARGGELCPQTPLDRLPEQRVLEQSADPGDRQRGQLRIRQAAARGEQQGDELRGHPLDRGEGGAVPVGRGAQHPRGERGDLPRLLLRGVQGADG